MSNVNTNTNTNDDQAINLQVITDQKVIIQKLLERFNRLATLFESMAEEHISALQDDVVTGDKDDDNRLEDLNDQIGHWESGLAEAQRIREDVARNFKV